MAAGKKNWHIEIDSLTSSVDASGYPAETWTAVMTPWAEVIMSGGAEFYAAQKLFAETTAVFKIRYVSNLTTRHRILCAGKTYDILSIVDPDGKRRELNIAAKEVV